MSDLHAFVSGFAGDAAEAYDRGRAGYPPEVIAALDLPARAHVLDLAAGTGLLSAALTAAGYDVVAVEPMADMRSRVAAKLGADRTLDGTAETIPLPDASVDAVTAGDAFHWFDADRAVAEIHRVLRPGGRVAIVWRWPDSDAGTAPWRGQVSEILVALRGEHPGFSGDQGRGAFARHGGFDDLEHRTVRFTHPTDRAGFLANIASISFVSRLPDGERAEVLATIGGLLAQAGAEPWAEPYKAEVFLTRRRDRARRRGRRAAAR